eukprot:TRINITY_DN11879_c0_g1_i1.p1 TRINITY_DN11879_c0_g1~~TRINITY_DN11879_c0_g1_i1.p1  ORF type:complete len:345 (+),score=51.89 TRINITY_DN11879_c0_g1_i1:87-1121(+)
MQTSGSMIEDSIHLDVKHLSTGSLDETRLPKSDISSDMEPLSEDDEEDHEYTCMSTAEQRAVSILRAHNLRSPSKGRRDETAVQMQAKDISPAHEPIEHALTCEASKWTSIIFDWDDTLFPTWFLRNIVQPASPDLDDFFELQADSPFLSQLQEHALLVREVLISASKIARVGIVTLAVDDWVEKSSEWYLPGLDLPQLLTDLNIRVYSARKISQRDLSRIADDKDGVNMTVVAKQFAMKKCLNKIRGNRDWKHANVISVGDSIYDHEACRECMFSHGREGNVCKTVKLLDDPTLKALDLQLKKLKLCLPNLAAHGDDVDFELEWGQPSDMKEHSDFWPREIDV